MARLEDLTNACRSKAQGPTAPVEVATRSGWPGRTGALKG